jgi:subtilisin family serine protease
MKGGRPFVVLGTLVAIFAQPATVDAAAPAYVAGHVIVRFDESATAADRAGARRQVDGRFASALPVAGTQVVQLPVGASPPAAAAALETDPAVDYAEPDWLYWPTATPNDPSFGAQWNMTTIGAPQAWNGTTGSSAVKVGIVDTGIDLEHPDLLANLDPARGRDFIGSCPTGSYSVSTCGDSVPDDESGHGTHVAGIAGAVGNNGTAVAGVNWTTDLIAERVCGPVVPGGSVSCPSSAISAGITDAAARGARVINLSLGGSSLSPTMEDAIRAAPNVVVVTAAGNGDSQGVGLNLDTPGVNDYPCELPEANVVCVAATTRSDGLASYSNYGAGSVELGAPGGGTPTGSVASEPGVTSTGNGGGTTSMQGTSMAAPHVSGAAALMLSVAPDASLAQLRSALMSGAHPLPALSGRTTSGGRLDLPGALTAIGQAPPLTGGPQSGSGTGSTNGSPPAGSSGGAAPGTPATPVPPSGETSAPPAATPGSVGVAETRKVQRTKKAKRRHRKHKHKHKRKRHR